MHGQLGLGPSQDRGQFLGHSPACPMCADTGSAAHAQHNFLGLHSSSKRWRLWLPGVVLGPGTLEKGGYELSRPGWEFRASV